MSKSIGIDLGTTNSVAAIRRAAVEVLQSRENHDHVPSVVGLHRKGQLLIGHLAVDNMKMAPKDTVISVKRLMGRAFRDEQVQRVRERYQYSIIAPSDGTDESVRVRIGGKEYSPPEVSAEILKKIKGDAELRLNDTVEYAVITVPAYFTEKQKEATRRAGQIAGLKVQHILDEPTAAAIAFGIDNLDPNEAKNILVYDLGGGTFDVSVLTVAGGVFAQVNIEGDMWCGGDDFDFRIVDYVLEHIKDTHGIDARQQASFMALLKQQCEQAKKALSSMMRTDIFITGALKDGDDLVDVDLEITRSQFEGMIAPKIRSTIETVKAALDGAGFTPDQIDYVLLVGGSSTIPMVRKALSELFGEKKLRMDVDPMKCVAYGAAILSNKLGTSWKCSQGHVNDGKADACTTCQEPAKEGMVLATVTAMHYGIETKGGAFAPVIEKGTPFPMPEPKVRRFLTPLPNLRRVKVPIYAGSHEIAAQNDLQANVWLELPAGVPADTPLDIEFSLDDDGILKKIRVALVDGSGTSVESYLDRGDDKRSRVEKKLEELRRRREEVHSKLSAGDESEIESAYSEATRALNQNDPAAAEEYARKIEKALVSGDADWVKKADGACNYGEYALSEYNWLIDAMEAKKLEHLISETRAAVTKSDQALAEAKTAELNSELDKLPAIVILLMNMVTAQIVARERHEEGKAEKLRAARQEIELALKRGDGEAAKSAIDRVDPLVMEMIGRKPVAISKEDLVKQA